MLIILFSVFLLNYFSMDFKRYREDNVNIVIDKIDIQYKYKEQFSGNQWYLYIDEKCVSTFEPFESYSVDEMKEHLKNKSLIKTVYNNESDICVYAFPLIQYQKKYKIIYTINKKDYYCWNDDVKNKDDKEINKRLTQLYKYVKIETINKVSNESWSRTTSYKIKN